MIREDKRKELLNSAARSARTHLVLDNLTGKVNFDDLCAFVTTPQWTDRRMHSQDFFVADNVTTIFMTGNTFEPGDDLMHRSIFVDLYVQEADPGARKIENPIDNDWILDRCNRRDCLSALWGMVSYWDKAGRPPGEIVLPDFRAFSEVVGGIVVCAGGGWASKVVHRMGWTNPMERRTMHSGGNEELRDFLLFLETVTRMADEEDMWEASRLELKFWQVQRVVQHCGFFAWMVSVESNPPDEFKLGGDDQPEELDMKEKVRLGKLLARRSGSGKDGSVYELQRGQVRVVHVGSGRHRRLVIDRDV